MSLQEIQRSDLNWGTGLLSRNFQNSPVTEAKSIGWAQRGRDESESRNWGGGFDIERQAVRAQSGPGVGEPRQRRMRQENLGSRGDRRSHPASSIACSFLRCVDRYQRSGGCVQISLETPK